MKTSELNGSALDWAVAKCEVVENTWGKSHLKPYEYYKGHSYSTDWAQGGPIIEREDISFRKYYNPKNIAHEKYYAKVCRESGSMIHWSNRTDATGPTPLIAAMRCYVASKLGENVDIPKELEQ